MSSLCSGSCDNAQWAQTGTQELLPEHKEGFLSCEGDSALGHTTYRGCGISFSGGTQKHSQHDPVQAALGKPALAGVLDSRSHSTPKILWSAAGWTVLLDLRKKGAGVWQWKNFWERSAILGSRGSERKADEIQCSSDALLNLSSQCQSTVCIEWLVISLFSLEGKVIIFE